MEKQKKFFLITMPIILVALVVFIVLFAINFISALFFGLIFSFLILLLVANIVFLVLVLRKMKRILKEKEKFTSTGNYYTDLYTLLGIPVQYNKDGSIKDIYDLLQINPIFDENGNRVLTVYELLGVVPRFNKDYKEVPFVFVIKNGVRRIAKVDLTSRVLTRKLTEEEKEMLAIREALTQKLKEAEKQGDAQKAQVIIKALQDNKPKKKDDSKSDYKPVIYIMGKSDSAINSTGVENRKNVVSFKDGFNIFGARDKGAHSDDTPQNNNVSQKTNKKFIKNNEEEEDLYAKNSSSLQIGFSEQEERGL